MFQTSVSRIFQVDVSNPHQLEVMTAQKTTANNGHKNKCIFHESVESEEYLGFEI